MPYQPRQRLVLDLGNTAVYAIGDVHGCLDELLALEQKIENDALQFSCRKLIVMLGDYIDRGPHSTRVLKHLLKPAPRGFDRICLLGNHEQAMLDYLDDRLSLSSWLSIGAAATLYSYGIDPDHLLHLYQNEKKVDAIIRKQIPDDHVQFLRSLPIMASTKKVLFVHAGVRPGIAEKDQADIDLITIRTAFLTSSNPSEKWVIHGHTPVSEPEISARRLNLDTGVYRSGILSAVRLGGGEGKFLSTRPD